MDINGKISEGSTNLWIAYALRRSRKPAILFIHFVDFNAVLCQFVYGNGSVVWIPSKFRGRVIFYVDSEGFTGLSVVEMSTGPD